MWSQVCDLECSDAEGWRADHGGQFSFRAQKVDPVPRRLVDKDLLAAHAVHDVVAEPGPGRAHLLDRCSISATLSRARFQSPGSGFLPSGIGRDAPPARPAALRASCRSPRESMAKPSPGCIATLKPKLLWQLREDGS
jgi:hypothetical protein